MLPKLFGWSSQPPPPPPPPKNHIYTESFPNVPRHHELKYNRVGAVTTALENYEDTIDEEGGDNNESQDRNYHSHHRTTIGPSRPPQHPSHNTAATTSSSSSSQQQKGTRECTNSSCYCYHAIKVYIQRHASFLTSVLCGQCIAMIVTSMNTSSYLLITKQHVHTNFFQLFFVYILIAVLNQNYHHLNDNIDDNVEDDDDVPPTSDETLAVTHMSNPLPPCNGRRDHDKTGKHNHHVDDYGRTNDDDHDDDEYSDDDLIVVINDDEDDNDDNLHHSNNQTMTKTKQGRTTTQPGSIHDILVSTDLIPSNNSTTTTTTPTTTTPIVLYSYSIPVWSIWDGTWTHPTIFQLHIPIHYYVLISLMDIVSNILSIYSFHFTTLTSTTLLGSISIPSAMFFARLLLRKVFTPVQYIGIVLCIIGGCYTVYIDSVTNSNDTTHPFSNDMVQNSTRNTTIVAFNSTSHNHTSQPESEQQQQQQQQQQHPQQYIGDLMAITAAVLYGLGDCVAEYFIKFINRREYLYMIGIFGMMFTMVIVPIFEYSAVKDLFITKASTATTTDDGQNTRTNSSTELMFDHMITIGLFIWFIASVTMYYMIEALFLIFYDATFLNLSMQSVNIWAYLIMYLINPDGVPSSNFFIAILLVFTGVCSYEMGAFQNHLQSKGRTSKNRDSGGRIDGYHRCTCRNCIRDSRLKPRRDSEVEIAHGTYGQNPVNYQSLQLLVVPNIT